MWHASQYTINRANIIETLCKVVIDCEYVTDITRIYNLRVTLYVTFVYNKWLIKTYEFLQDLYWVRLSASSSPLLQLLGIGSSSPVKTGMIG